MRPTPRPALHALLAGLPGPHSLAEIGLREDELDDAATLLEEELGLDARELLAAAHSGRPPAVRTA